MINMSAKFDKETRNSLVFIVFTRSTHTQGFSLYHLHKFISIYSADSLIPAPIIRKSR